jgi:hypothetical protein
MLLAIAHSPATFWKLSRAGCHKLRVGVGDQNIRRGRQGKEHRIIPAGLYKDNMKHLSTASF